MAQKSSLLEVMIRLSQYTPLGNAKVSHTQLQASAVATSESAIEASQLESFLRYFPELPQALAGLTVLDFGCGYGGKAAELAHRLPSAKVIATDIGDKKMQKARAYAQSRGIRNVSFLACGQAELPLAGESVDAVVSHDVLEHVQDPAVSMRELHRVLRPGGRAYIVFPPYDGALSHHLDFITLLPGIHWVFKADTIMATVNALLDSPYGERFHTTPQPMPMFSKYARKKILPNLNGLGSSGFAELGRGLFEIERLEPVTFMDKLTKLRVPPAAAQRVKRAALSLLPFARDHLTLTLAVTCRRT
jgi:ubiquinone/menaquinone biosynthesis C-methylase UbiE